MDVIAYDNALNVDATTLRKGLSKIINERFCYGVWGARYVTNRIAYDNALNGDATMDFTTKMDFVQKSRTGMKDVLVCKY